MPPGRTGARRYDIDLAAVIRAYEAHGHSVVAAAQALGIHQSALTRRLQSAKRRGDYDYEQARGFKVTHQGGVETVEAVEPEFKVEPLPPEDVDILQLVEQRKRQFARRQEYERAANLIKVKVKIAGPIGVLHYGDPHVDDDGTNITALEEHARIVNRTPGLFAATVGDMSNNWVGRLARLYADQSTSAKQAWALVEWFINLNRGKWLYMVGGNHDAWSGAGDPLNWITRQNDALYKASECRLEMQMPGGRQVRINARHDFAGGSQWNPAHGPMKALTMGVRDHVAICGHKHESAYGVLKCPTSGITMHAIRVASYKTYDRYAKDKGFRDQTLSPCAVTVVNTALPEDHPDYVKVYWDPAAGAEYLTFLRKRAA